MMIADDFSIQHDERLADWRRRSSVDPGIIHLARAMVDAAIRDLGRKKDSIDFCSALAWMFEGWRARFTFDLSCELSGLNADLIRHRVREYLDSGRKVPKIRTSERKAGKGRVNGKDESWGSD